MNSLNKLISNFKNNKSGHAYLIETNNVVYAYDIIYNALKEILCPNEYQENCLNECNLCLQIENKVVPSIITIEPEGLNILQEQIENMKLAFVKNSLNIKYNVYFILYPEKLNKNAANKLLKFLEEPESDVFGFLITSNKSDVLSTILSRCQIIKLFEEKRNQSFSKEIVDLGDKFIDNIKTTGASLIVPNKDKISKVIESRVMLSDFITYLFSDYQKKYQGSIDNNDLEEIKINLNVLKIIKKYLDLSMYNVNMELFYDCLVIEIGRCYNGSI